MRRVSWQFYARLGLIALVFLGVALGAFLLANYLNENAQARQLVGEYGYFAVLVIAIVSGLNAIVPVPAATFTPVFVAAGLSIPVIIVMLTIGTLIADLIGFFFGSWSRTLVQEKYPRTIAYLTTLKANHEAWILPAVMVYAAVIPFPNEAILIPLALMGVRFSTLLVPLIIGNAFNQAALAYGFNEVFMLAF